jgi:D-alanine-D-alanine ligase
VRIVFAFNMLRDGGEAEAEFDTPETVGFVAGLLEGLGHEVERIDAGVPLDSFVERLAASAPDLVFNSAEGRYGRFREALYPALYDELGIPYTGSGAWACAVTLDKRLTKILVTAAGVRTPVARFLRAGDELEELPPTLPLIVKPNFEGSSMGIGPAAVVVDAGEARVAAESALRRFPDGVLVEEFVTGRDISVAFLEPYGVLAGVEYEFAGPGTAIYHFELKNERSEDVEVRAPASLTPEQEVELAEAARVVFDTCSIRDLARADFRLALDGTLWFLEVNPLPSLEDGAGIYAAAALEGLSPKDVVAAVVESALRRHAAGVPS